MEHNTNQTNNPKQNLQNDPVTSTAPSESNANILSWDDFQKVKMAVGTITAVRWNEKARKPSYVLTIDFGPYGIKTSSAQFTHLYKPEDLLGQQMCGVINFPTKNIAGVVSEVLVLGCSDAEGRAIMLRPTHPAPNGSLLG